MKVICTGGILTQSRATWRAVFYMQSGLGVLFVVLGFIFLVKQPPTQRYTKGLDWGGALLSAAGIGLLTYSLASVLPIASLTRLISVPAIPLRRGKDGRLPKSRVYSVHLL